MDFDFKVPPRKWASIEEGAIRLREAVGLGAQPYAPVVDVLDKVLHNKLNMVEMIIVEDDEMDGALGYASPDGKFIKLSNSTYEKACANDGRARFTIAHEIGHWFLHTDVPLARITAPSLVKTYERAEPQANHFAACFLMPTKFIKSSDIEIDMMARFGVSFEAASIRLDKVLKR